jgi:anti-sigma B factor antagonist
VCNRLVRWLIFPGANHRMGVTESQIQGRLHIALDGELDLATAPVLEQALARAVEARADITVDLSGCSFIDARGIRVLANSARSLDAEERKLRVIGLAGQPEQIFTLTLSYLRPIEVVATA